MYKISDSVEYSSATISADLFGLNFVLSYDMEFLETGPLLDLLGSLAPDNLRYPGGSVTETMFSRVEYNSQDWASQYFASIQNGSTQKENMVAFVQSAAEINASIQLVLPTSIAFTQSAGQAIEAGSYGDRRQIDPRYYDLIDNYIEDFLSVSAENGVPISRLEIGNEFWGSGRMTASEYGYLAASVTEYLAKHFPSLDVVAQVSYIAGFFSPVEDTKIYLAQNGDDFDTYFPWQDLTSIPGLVEHTLPGQGSGVGQTQDIASQFLANPMALSALDGIVDHLYFRKGFDGIDNERNHGLIGIPQTFEDTTGLESIDTFITEWSVRNISGDRESDSTNHTGLQYAGSTLEAFFELAQHNVTGANFWPTTFGNEGIDRRVLIDTSEQDLTFGGEIFRLLSTNLVGLSPIFDFEVSGEIDIHGFSDSDSLVFFASERSGEQSNPKIDFSNYSFDEKMFLSVTYLSGDDPTGVEINSNPIVKEFGGASVDTQIIDLDLDPWSIAMVNIQNITSSDDILTGTGLGDHIAANSGNDTVYGGAGDDRIYGQFGHDILYGGEGNDSLYGGWGDDFILGGEGDDFISGTFGKNTLYGGGGNDVIVGSNDGDVIQSGFGDDLVTPGLGSDVIYAGPGDDEIDASTELDVWEDGSGALNVVLFSQTGISKFVPINGFVRYSDVIYGGNGHDTLRLSDREDAFFLDDSHSEFHSSLLLDTNNEGLLGAARVLGIEVIDAGKGDDIIDLTSDRYTLEGESIEIHGGAGNDTIWGSSANETILGGNGDDILFGGLGVDVLTGGAGSDVFEFGVFDSQDSISDFRHTDGDMIHIYSSGEIDDVYYYWDDGSLIVSAALTSSPSSFSLRIDMADMNSDIPPISDISSSILIF